MIQLDGCNSSWPPKEKVHLLHPSWHHAFPTSQLSPLPHISTLARSTLHFLIAFINPAKDYFLGNYPGVGKEAFEVNWFTEGYYGRKSLAQGGENVLPEHPSARLNPNIILANELHIIFK